MAAPAPPDKVKDKEYTNWLKVTLALYYMKSGLHNFIQTEVNFLHQSLVQTIYGGQTVPIPPCSTCNAQLLKINKHNGQNQCKSYCDDWLHELLKLHVSKKADRIYLDHSDIPSWPFKPWECAKVFMPRGQPPSSSGPADCDAQALMTLLANCIHFHKKLSPNGLGLTHTISKIRNSVMHSGEMKLSDGDRTNFIPQIIQLLEDPVSLKSIEECKTAVGNIRKIDNDSVDVFFNVDLHMIALTTAVNEFRQELGMHIQLNKQLNKRFQDFTKELSDGVAEHAERLVIIEENVTKLQRQREYSQKAMLRSLTVEDLHKAWKSIEDFLVEELAPKDMLTYFENGSLLPVEESRDMCELPRVEVAKKLLQRIKENLPVGFCCLLDALDDTKQEVIVKQLEVKIKETLNPQPETHSQETCGKEQSAVKPAEKGKEQSAVKPAEEGIIVKVEVLKGGKQMHRIESSVGNDVKGRIVLDYDMRSVCMKHEPGSVIIYLRALSKHAKDTLPFFCQHGGMKNFVLDLLKKKDIFSCLPEGEICIRIQVCYGKDFAFEDVGGQNGDFTQMVENDPLRQHDSFTVTDNPHVIKQNLLLQYGNIVEEIEPLQFQDTFVNRGILDKSCFEELKLIDRRRARAAQFLNQVMNEDNTALAALVYALRNSGNDVLANRLCNVRNISSEFSCQVEDSCIEVVQEDSKTHAEADLIWSCDLTVDVRKNEDVNRSTDGDKIEDKMEPVINSYGEIISIENLNKTFDLWVHTARNVDIRKTSPESPVARHKLRSQGVYEINRHVRGKAILIANTGYHSLKLLKSAYEQLQFRISVHVDKSTKEILEILQNEAQKQDTKTANAIVFIIYGTPDNFDMSELPKVFSAENCPQLKGKPKMFYVIGNDIVIQQMDNVIARYSEPDYFVGATGYVGIMFYIYVLHMFAHELDAASMWKLEEQFSILHSYSERSHSTLRKEFYFFPGLSTSDMPQEIEQMDPNEIELYLKMVEKSSIETYNMRLMFVGLYGAGKTSLVRRMMNRGIDGVTSTDGIDVYIGRCRVNLMTGEWTTSEGI